LNYIVDTINRGSGIIDATLIFTAIHEKAIILTFDKKIIKYMDELQKK